GVADLAARFPEAAVEIEFLGRCGARLPEVLGGSVDALDVLFRGGSAEAVGRLYREWSYSKAAHAAVRHVLQAVLERLPAGRLLRVLEVGAGTGSATEAALSVLDAGRAEYVFSDISPAFLAHAKEKFRDSPHVRYRTLDLEQPPESQGL